MRLNRRDDERERWSPTVQRALKKAEELGLRPPRHPGGVQPRLPEDITGLDDRQLMDKLTEFTRWGDYSTVQLGLAAAEEKTAEAQIKRAEARALIGAFGDRSAKGIQDIKNAQRRLDADDEHQRYLEAYALRKLLEGIDEGIDKDGFSVSRELTRRLGREPRDRRERRWGT